MLFLEWLQRLPKTQYRSIAMEYDGQRGAMDHALTPE